MKNNYEYGDLHVMCIGTVVNDKTSRRVHVSVKSKNLKKGRKLSMMCYKFGKHFLFDIIIILPLSTICFGRKNVLFLVADDLRVQLGTYNGPDFASPVHPKIYTPNLDKLAAKSMVSKRAYVQHALCSPSRTSLLMGREKSGHNSQCAYALLSGCNLNTKGGVLIFRTTRVTIYSSLYVTPCLSNIPTVLSRQESL